MKNALVFMHSVKLPECNTGLFSNVHCSEEKPLPRFSEGVREASSDATEKASSLSSSTPSCMHRQPRRDDHDFLSTAQAMESFI
jgi:hypothetical protein